MAAPLARMFLHYLLIKQLIRLAMLPSIGGGLSNKQLRFSLFVGLYNLLVENTWIESNKRIGCVVIPMLYIKIIRVKCTGGPKHDNMCHPGLQTLKMHI